MKAATIAFLAVFFEIATKIGLIPRPLRVRGISRRFGHADHRRGTHGKPRSPRWLPDRATETPRAACFALFPRCRTGHQAAAVLGGTPRPAIPIGRCRSSHPKPPPQCLGVPGVDRGCKGCLRPRKAKRNWACRQDYSIKRCRQTQFLQAFLKAAARRPLQPRTTPDP